MISENELKKIQKFAKLDFSDNEVVLLQKKLMSTIKSLDQLDKVSCTDIQPMISVSNSYQRLQEDKVVYFDIRDDLFRNVPQKDAEIAREVKCFAVPKVIE